jgi:SpoVK/Ycf46/Vps4 family AAA+-type ATPase
MAKLKITRKPFERVEAFWGTYTTDVSDTDDEAMIRDFKFVIRITEDVQDQMYGNVEIYFVDDETPPNIDLAIDEIQQHYKDLIS